jgi:ligand-binding SRPBCC domain-containing protein
MRHAFQHTFLTDQWVPYPVERVFDFFADPRNLPPLMPAWQKARIVEAAIVAPSAPASGRIPTGHEAGAGSRITLTFRVLPLFPLRLRWEAVIEEFAWDEHFCDGQPKGPFAHWRHCHRLRAENRTSAEGTVITDAVTFAFPFGVVGELAYRMGGARQVRKIFGYRQQQFLRMMSGSD